MASVNCLVATFFKYIILGSTAKRNSYRFGTTNLYEFHFWVNCPFKEDKLNTDIEQK